MLKTNKVCKKKFWMVWLFAINSNTGNRESDLHYQFAKRFPGAFRAQIDSARPIISRIKYLHLVVTSVVGFGAGQHQL